MAELCSQYSMAVLFTAFNLRNVNSPLWMYRPFVIYVYLARLAEALVLKKRGPFYYGRILTLTTNEDKLTITLLHTEKFS